MDVLVAGASRGIGAAIATGFARDGARRVVLVGRTRADLEGVAEDVRAAGATADVVVADLTDVGAARDAVAGAGELDAVVWACSARARMVTGTSLLVDGGWTAH